MIKDIKAGGPAELAGVKDQMILIAINGQPCAEMSHKAVVNVVKTGGKNCILRCRITVETTEVPVEKETETVEKEEAKPDEEKIATNSISLHAKLCRVVKSPKETFMPSKIPNVKVFRN